MFFPDNEPGVSGGQKKTDSQENGMKKTRDQRKIRARFASLSVKCCLFKLEMVA